MDDRWYDDWALDDWRDWPIDWPKPESVMHRVSNDIYGVNVFIKICLHFDNIGQIVVYVHVNQCQPDDDSTSLHVNKNGGVVMGRKNKFVYMHVYDNNMSTIFRQLSSLQLMLKITTTTRFGNILIGSITSFVTSCVTTIRDGLNRYSPTDSM
jgi:hypothetical protein